MNQNKFNPNPETGNDKRSEECYIIAVREGLAELNRHEGIPHDEVKRQFDSWFSKTSPTLNFKP